MPAIFLLFVAIVMGILVPRSLYLIPLVAGFGGTALYMIRRKAAPSFDKPLFLFFGAVCVISLASTLWSVNPDDTLERSINTLFILAGGALMISLIEHLPALCSKKQKYITAACVVGYAGASLFLLFEYTNSFPVMNHLSAPDPFPSYGLNRSVVTLGLFFLPLLYLGFRMLHTRKAKLAVTALTSTLVFIVLSHTQSQTAQMALLCGLGTYGVFYMAQKQAVRSAMIKAFMGILCIAILAAPLIPTFLQEKTVEAEKTNAFVRDANIMERLEIWTFISGKIAERPLTGHGIEATKNIDADKVFPLNKTDNFLHPHNAFLQIWLETGLIGALIVCGFALLIGRRILAAPAIAQPLYLSMVASCACMLSTGYGLWQSWHLGLMLSAAALAIFVTRISAKRDL